MRLQKLVFSACPMSVCQEKERKDYRRVVSLKMSNAGDDTWARMSMVLRLRGSYECRMCGCKMSGKRSKSLSPKPSSSQDYKRPKIEGDGMAEAGSWKGNILDFSDDVLLNIMKYLHPQDLLALSLCCKRLDGVCRDRTLWRNMDCRNEPMDTNHLEKYVKFLQPSTARIALRGNLETKTVLSPKFLEEVRLACTNLKEITVEDCDINAQEIQISSFPETIEKLSLKGCKLHNVTPNRSYFFKINIHLARLTCLILSGCGWVTSHSLLVISKIPNLKELRLDSCDRLNECVAYASLATRFGFKTLEILDLRDTALGDSEICCFSSTKTLTHVYLECPSKSMNRRVCRQNRINERLHNIVGEPIYEDPNLVQYIAADEESPWDDFERCLVSDRAVCALGTNVLHRHIVLNPLRYEPHRQDVVFEDNAWVTKYPKLKTLVVRNYSRVTNSSLDHLAASAFSLELLDVTGTSVTKEGILSFKNARPNVKVISSFNEE